MDEKEAELIKEIRWVGLSSPKGLLVLVKGSTMYSRDLEQNDGLDLSILFATLFLIWIKETEETIVFFERGVGFWAEQVFLRLWFLSFLCFVLLLF